MSSKDCYAVVIRHEYGVNVTACATYELAYNELHEFVKEYWHEVSDDEPPLTTEEAIDFYFDHKCSTEFWEIVPTEMVGF